MMNMRRSTRSKVLKRQQQRKRTKSTKQSQTECNNSKFAIELKKDESEEHLRVKFQMTNFQLFMLRSKCQGIFYPSSFSLINSASHHLDKKINLTHLKEVKFPVLMYSIKELISFSVMILKTSEFVRLKISDKSIQKLAEIIAQNYNCVSYHNFSHAFSLCLLNYQCFAKQNELRSFYTEEEYFYILLAGLSHDLNHPGTNNSFQIKSNSQLNQLTGGVSVLQNMHIRTLWGIFQDYPELDILQFSTDKFKAKKIITRLILSTDMAVHFRQLDVLRRMRGSGEFYPKTNEQQKWVLMQQIFHACDIGNPTNEYDNYISWAALLSFQFDHQARTEQKMGLQVTQSFIYHDLSTLYKDQIWFLGNIVQPIWKEISCICPALTIYCDNISSNLERVTSEMQILRQ